MTCSLEFGVPRHIYFTFLFVLELVLVYSFLRSYQIKTKYFFIRHMAKENIVKHNSSDDDFSFIALKLAGSVQRHLTTAIISYIKRERRIHVLLLRLQEHFNMPKKLICIMISNFYQMNQSFILTGQGTSELFLFVFRLKVDVF